MVIQSKTLKLVRPPSFFCTSLVMRRPSSCDQVGPGVWATTDGAVRLKMSAAARTGNVRRVKRGREVIGSLRMLKIWLSCKRYAIPALESSAAACFGYFLPLQLQPFQRLVASGL